MKSLIRLTKSHWHYFLLIGVLSLFIIGLNILRTTVLQDIIQYIVIGEEVYRTILLLLVVLVLAALVNLVTSYTSSHLGIKFSKYIKDEIFARLAGSKLEDIQKRGEGEILGKNNNEANGVVDFLKDSLPVLMVQPLMFLAASVYMIIIDWRIYVACYVLSPLFLWIIKVVSTKSAKYSGEYYDRLSEANTMILDSIDNIEMIKSYTMLPGFLKRFDEKFRDIFRLVFTSEKLDAVTLPFYFLINDSPKFICLIVGGYLSVTSQIRIDELFAYLQLLNFVSSPLMELTQILGNFRRFIVQAKNVCELIDIEQETYEGDIKVPDKQTDLQFNNVCFSYGETKILEDINVTIKAGEKIALLGTSGAGKSTFFSLICGLHTVTKGDLLLNGQDIRACGVSQWRSRCTYVSQVPFLFSGTIRDNLEFGRQGVTSEEMRHAAQIAQIDEFIMGLEGGYDAIVEENGGNFSGGQRLRISIARAMIRVADILLLDEPTAALDLDTEESIMDNILSAMKEKTVIVSSHRYSTIRKQNRILFLTKNGLGEDGTHDELLQAKGLYYKFSISDLKVRGADDVVES